MLGGQDTFDYIIVGAGTAGCLLANRLSADRNARVLLLEAGGKDNYHWIHIPVGYLYLMGNPRDGLGLQDRRGAGPQRPQPQLSARPCARRLLVHQRHDLHARSGARLRPVAADGLSRLGLGRRAALLQEARGSAGTRSVRLRWPARTRRRVAHRDGAHPWDILDAFREAAEQAGIPKVDDFNRGNNEGCGYFHVNQKSGIRWNTTKAFLRPVRDRTEPGASRRTPWSSA